MTLDTAFMDPAGSYISLATWRKSGRAVATPVWYAGSDGALYAFSNQNAGKIKRLRNFADCFIAPCTVSGKLRGNWHQARARIIDSTDEQQHAHTQLRRKYGWQMRLLDAVAGLSGRREKRVFIRIDPV